MSVNNTGTTETLFLSLKKWRYVNVSLKFRLLISEIHQYFLLKNCEKLLQCKSAKASLIFFNKKISVYLVI